MLRAVDQLDRGDVEGHRRADPAVPARGRALVAVPAGVVGHHRPHLLVEAVVAGVGGRADAGKRIVAVGVRVLEADAVAELVEEGHVAVAADGVVGAVVPDRGALRCSCRPRRCRCWDSGGCRGCRRHC